MKRKIKTIFEPSLITDKFCFLEGFVLTSGSETATLSTNDKIIYYKLEPGKSKELFFPKPIVAPNGLFFNLTGKGAMANIYYSEDVDDISDYLLKEKMEIVEEKNKIIYEKERMYKQLEQMYKQLEKEIDLVNETNNKLLEIIVKLQTKKPNLFQRLWQKLGLKKSSTI